MPFHIRRAQPTLGLHRRELVVEVIERRKRLIAKHTFSNLLRRFADLVAHVATAESVGPLHGIGSLPTDT